MNTAIRKVMRRIVTKHTTNQHTTSTRSENRCNYSDNYYGDQCCMLAVN